MNILVADDSESSRKAVERSLLRWGYDVECVSSGADALQALSRDDGPKIAILDWIMPVLSGVEVCRALRAQPRGKGLYLIVLTARTGAVVEALEAGADDYLTKPCGTEELRARVSVARRVVELQSELASRVDELSDALEHVQKLQGIIPICMHCHSIRDDRDSWNKLENYISNHSDAQFSHGICPKCMDEHYPDV